MNKRAQILKVVWLLIGAMLIITLIALIEPLKANLSSVMTNMQCSTPRDGYRGSCIALRGSLVAFILGVGYYILRGIIEKK